MSAPVASFNFAANALAVQFTDLSTNTPTSWDWDFGDASPHGTTQNPSHTYSVSGSYTVKLTATNTGGSNSFSYSILVDTQPIVNQTVETMVLEELPTGFDISPIELSQAVRKWQMYLQPKVYIPYAVAESDMFNQSKWPGLVNVLVSKLIVYEQLLAAASKTMLAASSLSTSGSSGSGGLKRIESGPSVAEWYDASTMWKEIFQGNTDTGFFGALTTEVCIFAKRVNISIPEVCTGKKLVRLFGVGKKIKWRWC